MTLSPGTRLGPYEILALLGRGGMGEVYRAKDSRLDRTVAVKVLPPHVVDSPRRRQRFQRESRAASRLSHPNICAVYDVGEQNDLHFIVMEYLEGETLADRLRRGPLLLTQAIRCAIEVADALDHAHHEGIVHRDLKPANIMLVRSGAARSGQPQAKLLDFGVAQLRSTDDSEVPMVTSQITETQSLTEEGTILGTLHYMAPEQLEGKETDARTDIFALGAVIHEMATGRHAFEGTSKASLIAAILEHEPPPLSAARGESSATRGAADELTPPLLDRVVSKCLAKDPAERWQTAADLKQALKWIAEGRSQIDAATPSSIGSRRRERLAWAAIVGLLIAVVTYFAARSNSPAAQTTAGATFKQLTFKRGFITGAQFAPDGQTIIYAPAWDGGPPQLYETRTTGPESRRLGAKSAGLASISSNSELALFSSCRVNGGFCTGTLARMPVSGGAPRDVLEDVQSADFTPDGRELAVIHVAQGESRLEFPIGKVLYRTAGWLQGLAFSPRGDHLAFIDHPIVNDESGVLKMIDMDGRATTVSSGWRTIRGISWSPDGSEIWFTGSQTGKICSVYAVSPSGQLRLIFHAPADMVLFDVSRDGRLLLSASSPPVRARMMWVNAGVERELSWLDWSTVADLSADGKTVLFHEGGVGVGATPVVYVRNVTDGSDAVRLGEGKALSLSPDGRWALAVVEGPQPQLVLLPTGTGQPRRLPSEGLTDVYLAKWFPDARRLLIVAAGANNIPRSYVQDVDTGRRDPLGDEGTMAVLVSPDGRKVLEKQPSNSFYVRSIDGGQPVQIEAILPDDFPIRWSADGRYLYLRGAEEDLLRVYRYDFVTKRRGLWRELMPRDPTGVISMATEKEVAVTPDGQSYAFTYWVVLEDLFLVEGLQR